jgi:hypothetical protein
MNSPIEESMHIFISPALYYMPVYDSIGTLYIIISCGLNVYEYQSVWNMKSLAPFVIEKQNCPSISTYIGTTGYGIY